MGCGCKNKKKRNKLGEPSTSYAANGSLTEPMGLNQFINLPIRLPRALNGKDIIIAANKKSVPPITDALIIIGRNAKIDVAHKKQLVEKWPQAFNA